MPLGACLRCRSVHDVSSLAILVLLLMALSGCPSPGTGPDVTSFALNAGEEETATRSVVLNNACVNAPTAFMASESSTFAGAAWKDYQVAPTLTLSPGSGVKTVYFKVRNAAGESDTASDSITLNMPVAPAITSFVLNNGDAETAARTVSLDSSCDNAPTEIMASQSPNFVGASWLAYETNLAFALTPGNGNKTVYFKARNAHGESNTATDTILLNEPVPPVLLSFSINNVDAATTSRTVILGSVCSNQPSEYMASESSDFAGASWTAYEVTPAFTLSEGGGVKTVYFRARNAYGESNVKSDTIALDEPAPPVVTAFAINNGNASTTSRAVTLHNACTNTPTEFMASESPRFTGATWKAYQALPGFTLSSGMGVKTVYFKVRNAFGESAVVSDTITVNIEAAPVVTSFMINNGAVATDVSAVTLNSVCTNAPTHYMASESSDFVGVSWSVYGAAPAFTLAGEAGLRTVYFKARNSYGESGVVSDTITLNGPLPPVVTSFALKNGADQTTTRTVTLNSECTNHPTQYKVSESASFEGASWLPYGTTPDFSLSAGNGEKTVYFKVRNAWGESAAACDTIALNQPANFGYVLDRLWPELSQPWYFNWLTDVTVDDSGDIYIADSGNWRIVKLTSDGTFVTAWGSKGPGDGQFFSPVRATADAYGNVYVADGGPPSASGHRIQKFTSEGRFLAEWGTYQYNGGPSSGPNGVAVDDAGSVYVADGGIKVFTPDGTFLGMWANTGVYHPTDLVAASSGRFYAVGFFHQIAKFAADGTVLAAWDVDAVEGDGDYTTDHCNGIAVDAFENVYMVNPEDDQIRVFTQNGALLTQWGAHRSDEGRNSDPTGIAVDPSGVVYVADKGNDLIQRFTTDGTLISVWGSHGSGNGEFHYPSDVAVDALGNVYVTDYWNHRIQKFKSDGTYLSQWNLGAGGSVPYMGFCGAGVAVDPWGNVIVAENEKHTVRKFTASGNLLFTLSTYRTTSGLEFLPHRVATDASGNIYVTDESLGTGGSLGIQKFASDGSFLESWPDTASFSGVAVDASGNVFTANGHSGQIKKISADGELVTQWGGLGSGNGQFRNFQYEDVRRASIDDTFTFGVAVDVSGNVYVTDPGNNRIQKFTSNGTFITKWGGFGTDPGQFSAPHGIAVDAEGSVYVADMYNNRIQKFRPE